MGHGWGKFLLVLPNQQTLSQYTAVFHPFLRSERSLSVREIGRLAYKHRDSLCKRGQSHLGHALPNEWWVRWGPTHLGDYARLSVCHWDFLIVLFAKSDLFLLFHYSLLSIGATTSVSWEAGSYPDLNNWNSIIRFTLLVIPQILKNKIMFKTAHVMRTNKIMSA